MEGDKDPGASKSPIKPLASEDKKAEESSSLVPPTPPDTGSTSSNVNPTAQDTLNSSNNSKHTDSDKDNEAEDLDQEEIEEIILDDDDDDETKPGNGPRVVLSEVLLELDDNLKSKLVSDLMQICEVDEDTAKSTLVAYRWSMQVILKLFM